MAKENFSYSRVAEFDWRRFVALIEMTPPAHTACPEGHPLYLCSLCGLVFEEGHADALGDGSRRCPQCLMGETGDFFGPCPEDAILHDSDFL